MTYEKLEDFHRSSEFYKFLMEERALQGQLAERKMARLNDLYKEKIPEVDVMTYKPGDPLVYEGPKKHPYCEWSLGPERTQMPLDVFMKYMGGEPIESFFRKSGDIVVWISENLEIRIGLSYPELSIRFREIHSGYSNSVLLYSLERETLGCLIERILKKLTEAYELREDYS